MIVPSGEPDDSFFEQVHSITRQIPKGRVTTYGAIARCLGTKLSAQMVGWAMKHAIGMKPIVPTHRVVNRVGLLSAKHHYANNGMQKLLEKEGVKIQNDTVVDFERLFWDPFEIIL